MYTVYPCKPQFYYIKVGFKGVKGVFSWWMKTNKVRIITTYETTLAQTKTTATDESL